MGDGVHWIMACLELEKVITCTVTCDKKLKY